MAFDPRAITRDEDRFRDELRQTPDWSLAGRASMALSQVLVAIPRTTYEGPVEGAGPSLQLAAQRVIGVRVFRSVRAAMAALSIGYEPEARALDRVLLELATHRDLIQSDPSGETASRWLEGKAGGGITKKVNATSPDDLYGNLSQEAHGDPRPVWRLYNEASESFILGPQRHALASRVSLLLYASAACDQLVVLAKLSEVSITQLPELHAEVKAAWRKAHEDADAVEVPPGA